MKKGVNYIIVNFILILIIFLGLVFSSSLIQAKEFTNINLTIKEVKELPIVNFKSLNDLVVRVVKEVPMVQLRELADIYDWLLTYDGKNQLVTIDNGSKIFTLKINQQKFGERKVKRAPLIISGRTYIDYKLFNYIFEDLEEEKKPEIITDLKINKNQVKAGETIKAEIIIYNISDKSVTLNYGSGQLYDLYLYKNEEKIWSWSADKFFTMALITREFEPQAIEKYKVEIPLKKELQFGEYILTGKIALVNPLKLGERRITILAAAKEEGINK